MGKTAARNIYQAREKVNSVMNKSTVLPTGFSHFSSQRLFSSFPPLFFLREAERQEKRDAIRKKYGKCE